MDAQAPANDLCINALPIVVQSDQFADPIIVNTSNATRDKDVADNCQYGKPPNLPGTWLTITGTGGRLAGNICAQRTYDYRSTLVSIFLGGCNP